jgi:glutaredoxin 3
MKLTVYSKTHCPYCVKAKQYLSNIGIDYDEINIEQDDAAREFIVAQGHRTVPQIYYQGRLFVEGGCDGLTKMTRQEIISELELRNELLNGTL